MYIAGIYLVSVILSYLIFRLTLIVDKKNEKFHPLGLATLICILPIINVLASLTIFFINIPTNLNFKRLFGIKG